MTESGIKGPDSSTDPAQLLACRIGAGDIKGMSDGHAQCLIEAKDVRRHAWAYHRSRMFDQMFDAILLELQLLEDTKR
jgi:hypothetical protein